MSEFVDLSLDEIIALQKSKAKRGGRNFGGTRGVKRRLNRRFPDRRTQGNRFQRNITKRVGEVCIVQVSNLGPLVTTADLQELFSEHPYVDVAMQYGDDGKTLGTAVVIFSTFEQGMRLKRQFAGVKLDGRVMDIFVSSSDQKARINSVQRGRITKRRIASQRGKKIGSKMGKFNRSFRFSKRQNENNTRKQMTTEELDRDLDAYMRGSKHAKIVAP